MMVVDADIAFLITLLASIGLATYYRDIRDKDVKKIFGVGVGVFFTLLICGSHIIHSILMVWGNIVILNYFDADIVHRVSTLYTWTYLTLLHTVLFSSTSEIWLFQALALRLVGLAFEMHVAALGSNSQSIKSSGIPSEINSPFVKPSPQDVASYAFFFVGLHKGPYYRWKIFEEHLRIPYEATDDYKEVTAAKLTETLLCTLVMSILRNKYPPSAYLEESFYTEHGADYRYLYSVPQILRYLMECKTLMNLNICVFAQAAFAVYPASSRPIAGFGPTNLVSWMKPNYDLESSQNLAMQSVEYSFKTIKPFDHKRLLLGPRVIDTMRAYNMPTRYFFWAYTKKLLIKSHYTVRSACAFLLWAIWWGPTIQQMVMASTLWVYIHLEKECLDLYGTYGQLERSWNIGYSIMRVLFFMYLAPCIVIEDTGAFLRYYNSIFWTFHVLLLSVILGNIAATKSGRVNHPTPSHNQHRVTMREEKNTHRETFRAEKNANKESFRSEKSDIEMTRQTKGSSTNTQRETFRADNTNKTMPGIVIRDADDHPPPPPPKTDNLPKIRTDE